MTSTRSQTLSRPSWLAEAGGWTETAASGEKDMREPHRTATRSAV
jgi:hypothetical protein